MVGKIECCSLKRFMEVVACLVRDGIGFKANAETLVIELTGSY